MDRRWRRSDAGEYRPVSPSALETGVTVLNHVDHLAPTVRDPEVSTRFYCDVLGLGRRDLHDGGTALVGAGWKNNLHHVERPVAPHAEHPVPASADLCFIRTVPVKRRWHDLNPTGLTSNSVR